MYFTGYKTGLKVYFSNTRSNYKKKLFKGKLKKKRVFQNMDKIASSLRGYVPGSHTALQREDIKLNSDWCSGRTCHPTDTSTVPTTGTHSALLAGSLGRRDPVPHAGCWPSPPRQARSPRPLAAQAEEIPGVLRGQRGLRQQRRKAPQLLGGRAFTGVRRWLHAVIWLKGLPSQPQPPATPQVPGSASVPRSKDARGRKSRPR